MKLRYALGGAYIGVAPILETIRYMLLQVVQTIMLCSGIHNERAPTVEVCTGAM